MPHHQSISSRPSSTPRLGVKHLLARSLMAAVLIGGAGAALSAGSAQANPCDDGACTWGEWTTAGNFLTLPGADKTFTYSSTAILGDLASSSVTATELSGDYFFRIDFLNPQSTTNPFDFTYVASITDPSRAFSAVDLDSDANTFADPASVLAATFTGGSSDVTLTSTNGSAVLEDVLGLPTTLTVRNEYDGNGAIFSFQNSYRQVPGPLPILGAGVAFGFSRKLRRRIEGACLKA
jgi:hypothetical protein